MHRSSRLSSGLLTTSSQSAISNERADKPPRERARGGKAGRLAVALLTGLLATTLFGCPEITGTNGAVRDNRTDKLLSAQSLGGLEAPPYSTVKVMTLHLALRAIKQGKFDENTIITISQHADDQDCNCFPGGNMSVLVPGDKMPVLMALYSIGLSHGEPTMAMAELVANVNRPTPVVGTGTSKAQSKVLEQEFIDMMNAEAFNLGLDNTHYTSVHGAPSSSQVTSVLDLAKLWDAAVAENSSFLTYTGTRKFPTLTWWPLSAAPYWANMAFPDRVYNYYPGIDGDKNGCCTNQAPGWQDIALVTQATRAGRSLTASVLLEQNQAAAQQDNAELLRWGFEQVFAPISWTDGSHASSVAAAHGMDCWAWSDVVTVSRTSTNALELIQWSTNPDSAAISKTATLTQSGASMGGVDVAWVNWNQIVAVYETLSRAGAPTVRASLYGTDDGIYPIASVDLGPGAVPEIERLSGQRAAVAFTNSGSFELRSLAVSSGGLSLEDSLSQYLYAHRVRLGQGTSPISGSPFGDTHVVAVVETTSNQISARGFEVDSVAGVISAKGMVTLGWGGDASVVRSGPLGHYAVSVRRLDGQLVIHFLDATGPALAGMDQISHSDNLVERTSIAAIGQHEFSAIVAERNSAGKLSLSVWDRDEANEAPGDFERLARIEAGAALIEDTKICELALGGSEGEYITSVRGVSGDLQLSAWSVASKY